MIGLHSKIVQIWTKKETKIEALYEKMILLKTINFTVFETKTKLLKATWGCRENHLIYIHIHYCP